MYCKTDYANSFPRFSDSLLLFARGTEIQRLPGCATGHEGARPKLYGARLSWPTTHHARSASHHARCITHHSRSAAHHAWCITQHAWPTIHHARSLPCARHARVASQARVGAEQVLIHCVVRHHARRRWNRTEHTPQIKRVLSYL